MKKPIERKTHTSRAFANDANGMGPGSAIIARHLGSVGREPPISVAFDVDDPDQSIGQSRRVLGRDKIVAVMLDISISSVWRLVKRGVIPPPIRVDGLSRFDLEMSLAAFRAAGKVSGGLMQTETLSCETEDKPTFTASPDRKATKPDSVRLQDGQSPKGGQL